MSSILENIKNNVKTNERLRYLIHTIKKINDKKIVDKINEIGKEEKIFFKRYGNKNKDKNILLIKISAKTSGMGVFLRYTLWGLFEAETMGFYPVVEYEKDTLYRENEKILNTNNVFEYYFNQTSKISLEEVYNSYNVYIIDLGYLIKSESLVYFNNETILGYNIKNNKFFDILGEIARKYLYLNKTTTNFIEKSIECSFNINFKKEKILAVHVRGTDYNLNWENHPNMVGVNDFFDIIDNFIEKYGFNYIFLATDDITRLERFKQKYNNKLLYFKDVHRSSGKVNVAHEKNDRKNNNYLNGLEVIRDIYVLARCRGLIAGMSQVSTCARIINCSFFKQYDYIKIIDKGIYKS